MGGLNAAFFVGLLCAIPLSVVANLLTPRIQSFMAGRAAASASNRVAQLKRRLASVANASAQNIQPSELLLEAIVTSSLVGAIGAVIAGLCFASAGLRDFAPLVLMNQIYFGAYSYGVLALVQTIGTVISALTSLVVINILSRARNRAADLRDSRRLEEELAALAGEV